MYFLDTNILSELRKITAGKGDKTVTDWFQSVPYQQLYLSSISLMEIEIGILSKERKDQQQGKILRDWFTNFVLPEFAERTLNVDKKVALCCAKLHVPDPRSERDALISATAIANNMIIVTRNVKDFEATGVKIINPLERKPI